MTKDALSHFDGIANVFSACTRFMQCCNALQAVVAILPSSKCLPEGVKATCSHFSSDAYVQMALHGYSLRQSFTTACQLLHRHKRRMRDCQGSACTAVLPGKVSSVCHATAMIWNPCYMCYICTNEAYTAAYICATEAHSTHICTNEAHTAAHVCTTETVTAALPDNCSRYSSTRLHH